MLNEKEKLLTKRINTIKTQAKTNNLPETDQTNNLKLATVTSTLCMAVYSNIPQRSVLWSKLFMFCML